MAPVDLHSVKLESDSPNLNVQYQRVIISHLAIKCTLRSDIKEFELVANAKNYTELGDIVIHLFYKNGDQEVILCRLKHVNNKGPLKHFDNLDKYEKLYEELKNKYSGLNVTVILFTNSNKIDYVAEQHKSFPKENILSIFNTNSEKSESYQILKNKSIYDNCYLFCNQINATSGKSLLSNDLDGCFTADTIHSVENYFLKTMPKRRNPYTKWEMIFILRNILMSPFVFTPSPPDEPVNESKSNQLLATLNLFNLIEISETNSRYLLQSAMQFVENKLKQDLSQFQWDQELPKDIVDELIKIKEIEKYAKLKIAYKPLSKKDLWLLFWAAGKLPLLVNRGQPNNEIKFILNNLSENVSIVLCHHYNLDRNLSVFTSLSDLEQKNSELLANILETTEVLLYFNKIYLKDIVNDDKNILQTINPDAFIELLCTNINISSIDEKLSFYINRQIQTKLYSKEVAGCGDIISIVDDDSSLCPLEKYDAAIHSFYSSETARATAKLASEKMEDFCCFQTIDDNYFSYSNKLKNPEIIETYAIDDQINESYLLNCESDCKIIQGPAGIGKTTFLKNLAQHSDCKKMYIYISKNDLNRTHRSSFESKESLADYLSDLLSNSSQVNHLKPFITKFLWTILENNGIYLLMDDFDQTDPVFKLLCGLPKDFNVSFILATRSNRITNKENILKTSSTFQLMEFQVDKQMEFNRRNSVRHDDSKTLIIDDVIKKISATPYFNFLGIPVLVNILTEISTEISKDVEQWNLLNILDKLIEKQMGAYKRKQTRRTIRQLACSLFFQEDLLKLLNINPRYLVEDLEDFQMLNKKDTMISNVTQSEMQFTHPIYAAFLSAQYLYAIFSDSETKELKTLSTLFELLFAEDLIHVRFFLDLMLSRKIPLFTAVLLNNQEEVEEILENNQESLLERDKLGRTIIHVVMGYGVRYNYPYKVGGLKSIKKLTSYNIFKQNKQFSISINILNILFDQWNKNDCADLFGNWPCTYGFFSRSYNFLNFYCGYMDLRVVPDINGNILFIYLVVNYDLRGLFEKCLHWEPFKNMKWEIDADGRNSIIHFFNNHNTIVDCFNIYMISELIRYDNYTILHLASNKNLIEIVRIIVEKQMVPLNCLDFKKWTPLDYAKDNNNQEVVTLLETKGATTNDNTTVTSNSTIENSPYLKYPECLETASLEELLINNNININAKVKNASPIYKAVVESDLKSLRLLVNHGADLSLTYDGFTILEIAAQHTATEVLEFLIYQHGKSNVDWLLLLYYSIAGRNFDNIEYLLTNKMNLGKILSDRNKTVMHLAAQVGDRRVMEILLENGGNIEVLDSRNKTPIFYAISGKNVHTLNYLIEKGANLNHRTNNKMGVMHMAAQFGNSKIMRILIENNCSVESLNILNETPIFFSIQSMDTDNLRFLIRSSAILEHRANSGVHIMHKAAELGNMDSLSILIENKCDIEVEDNDGRTPMFHAIAGGNFETFKYLKSKGANLNHKSNDGKMLKYAKKCRKTEIYEILLDCLLDKEKTG